MLKKNDFLDKCYVASVEQVETVNDETTIVLDGISFDSFNNLNEDTILNDTTIRDLSSAFFHISLNSNQIKDLNVDFENTSWVKFLISQNENDIPARVYESIEFEDNFIELNIQDIEPFNIEGKERIFSMNIFKEANRKDIQEIELENIKLENIKPWMVVVYNVGQGNCNGICDRRNMPLLYFDFGGGVFQNTKTYPGKSENPSPINFCFTYKPPVILSHWDWDHMASAVKHSQIEGSKWIVPKQNIGITHLKFAIKIYNKGNLLVWPSSLTSLNIGDIDIQKISNGNPSDKNNNGLTVIVKTTNEADQYNVLLPADANYSLINLSNYSPFHGLVATHHGASSHNCLNNIPLASNMHKIAYSYGNNNSFRHPRWKAVFEHAKQGWKIIRCTTNGHIALGQNGNIHSMPCPRLCSLLPVQ